MSAFLLFFIWSATRLPVPVRFCSFFVSRLSFVLSFVCSFFHSFHVSVFRFVFVFHFVSCRCFSSGRFLCARALFLFVAFLFLPFRCSARSVFQHVFLKFCRSVCLPVVHCMSLFMFVFRLFFFRVVFYVLIVSVRVSALPPFVISGVLAFFISFARSLYFDVFCHALVLSFLCFSVLVFFLLCVVSLFLSSSCSCLVGSFCRSLLFCCPF